LQIGVSTDGVSVAKILASTSTRDNAPVYFAPVNTNGGYSALDLDLSAYNGQKIYLTFTYNT
jgi:hypothetical protein